MKSRTTEKFRKAFAVLPDQIRRQGKNAYRLFRQNPHHRSLHFKQVHPVKPVYSVRINIEYRAVGVREQDVIVWFWVGPHAEYEKLLTRI